MRAETVDVFRDADRLVHAALASMTFGISPASVVQAWQDWALHLDASPGKQQEYLSRQLRNLTVWRISWPDAQRKRDWPAHAFRRCRRTGASAIPAGRSFRSARMSSPSCCGRVLPWRNAAFNRGVRHGT
ncbi:poly-beta-hydroxybutyrate polymerase domain-containing protein [Mesorhizobium alhagi CCNWXJ12-2]|uniref:Poly-beta-hydroxybutyrate polymerase domain-containing protein n=2 Tax=Allomesorhizobium alhagi TaxID=475067 RepID=H0I197_9HYPH|nr:poly-beta-hydroxybutyrate polymerase domain-containing protein [Mesorhizobium alhagi CCNWXJ12-2]